jgi:uncharacterized membrane protein YdjX (TVP38/TMEM64 family)
LRRFIGPKRIVILTVLAVLVGIAWYLRRQGWLDPSAIQHLIEQYPVTAPIVFALIYGIAMLSALPTLPVNLAAGLFWGPFLGGFYSTSGATIGAVAAFLLTRSVLGQPLARRFDNRVIAEIQREFEAKGWLFLAFVRLNPIFPTGPLNYLLGLTAVDTVTYVWTTFVFNLPPSIAVAWIGYSLGTFVIQAHHPRGLRRGDGTGRARLRRQAVLQTSGRTVAAAAEHLTSQNHARFTQTDPGHCSHRPCVAHRGSSAAAGPERAMGRCARLSPDRARLLDDRPI